MATHSSLQAWKIPQTEEPSGLQSVLIHVQFFEMLWTVARQSPMTRGFFRQEYWSGLSFPPPGDLLDPRIKPMSPETTAFQVDSLAMNY